MLENLVGKDGLPSPDFVRDLRRLCRMEADQLQVFADTFENLAEDLSDQSIAADIVKNLRVFKVDPEQIASSIRVALYLWDRWNLRRLSKDQIIADLQSLAINESALKNAKPLLNAMEKRLRDFRKFRIQDTVLATGTPKVDSAMCVIDGRTVFQSGKHEDKLNDSQEYYQIDHFVPIAILEIISELNGEKTTHTYILTESTLDNLKDILDRAGKRLAVVKERLCPPK
jgi:hypothetical protein